jgi:uncharacterized protein (TIGR03435 family)
MSRTVVMFLCLGGMAALADAQVSSPEFEVASVKPAGPLVPLGRLPPGQWRARSRNLVQLIGAAYPQYAFDSLVGGGPAWTRSDRFDIDARMDPTTTPAQLAQMISKLLADRFALRTHTERRPINVYVLTMSRADGQLGTQLKRSDPSCVEARTARQPLRPQCQVTATSGIEYRAAQISDFVRLLAGMGIDRPVYDRTGLTGYFDLQLQFDHAPFTGAFASPLSSLEGVSIFTALQEQAGLKLEATREVVDVLVIDSAEMPMPN